MVIHHKLLLFLDFWLCILGSTLARARWWTLVPFFYFMGTNGAFALSPLTWVLGTCTQRVTRCEPLLLNFNIFVTMDPWHLKMLFFGSVTKEIGTFFKMYTFSQLSSFSAKTWSSFINVEITFSECVGSENLDSPLNVLIREDIYSTIDKNLWLKRRK